MPTPLRVYCPGPEAPTTTELLAFARARGRALQPYEAYGYDDPGARDWDSLGLLWRPDRPPLFVELERPEGPDGRHVSQAILAAKRAIASLPPSPARDEAARRLAATTFVAAIQVPIDGTDDAAWAAAEALAACFEERAQGVTEVLGRGFVLAGAPLTAS